MIKRGSGLQQDPAFPRHPLHLVLSCSSLSSSRCGLLLLWVSSICLPILVNSNKDREAGKHSCHAQGYIGKATTALRAELQLHNEGNWEVGVTAITPEIVGQQVSETSGRRFEMLPKVGRCSSRQELFPMHWHQWNGTGWNIRIRYSLCSTWEEQPQQEDWEKSPIYGGRQFISHFNSDLQVQTLIASKSLLNLDENAV